uniref:NADH-ubiquinone oxidoreductase chain 4 n=1 Tax=Thraustotheca clavata TaxID=74557 RepID=S5TQ63_9STRA|nr:NADH dehydrogenase subunit 4 [Thraustotheca clavata]AGS55504.1 NADH dehydrogenase subunit 4 [Thraustotheca clavata]
MFNLLLFLIFLPIFGILILFFLKNEKTIKNFSIFYSFLIFIISLALWILFDKSSSEFQFAFIYNWLTNYNMYFSIGIDGISLFFIIATTFLIPICFLASYEIIQKNIKDYCILFFFLEFFLLITFSTLDLIIFYIFFESVLIPMFLIIGIWGSRERKIKASYYLFIYTLAGSLFMFIAIIHIYITTGTTLYILLYNYNFDIFYQKLYWLAFFLSFAVKVPMLPFHIWLPEAHVEAPTAGSVILAGILLKLGSYGLIRFSLPLFPKATVFFTPFVLVLCIISIIYASITAIRQTDLKRIIAYASVAHMNMILVGLFSLTIEGIEGSLLQMLSHSIVASALFLCIGILYDRYHSRYLSYYSGLAHTMPIYSIFFLFYIFANISIPGTSSFVGELLILAGIFQENTIVAFLSGTSMVLGGAYSLLLYNRVCYGNIQSNFLNVFYDISYREFLIHIILIFITLFMGIYPKIFLSCMHETIYRLVSHMEISIYYL